jgi:fructose 1,6-bisphosphate aldolase/phosphatase
MVTTTDRLHNIAGTYVGKDDPACIIRLQKEFPATEEMCSVFKTAHYVAGNTRGSHHLPLMPVKETVQQVLIFVYQLLVACFLVFMKGN